MIVFASMPSSMACRVRSGRQSTARRRHSIPPTRLDPIGSSTLPAPFLLGERLVAVELGVHIGYWGLGLTREDQKEIAQEAERLGYDSIWTAEAYGSDAAQTLGALAPV